MSIFSKDRRKREDALATPPGATLPAGLPTSTESSHHMPNVDADLSFPGGSGQASDNGLDVPPFRPALSKETAMSQRPFSSAPAVPPVTPAATARPAAMGPKPATREPAERRTLVVGRGISVQGTVQDAERLVVEGTVEASMIHAAELAIAPGGVFKGEVEVEDAEIAGTIDGTLTARASLIVRSSGRVLGTARCRRLQVEDGGQITGRIEMITEAPRIDTPPRPVAETAA